MSTTNPQLNHNHTSIVNQVLAILLKDNPLTPSTPSTSSPLTPSIVSSIFRSIPTFFFTPTRSIGRQSNPTRHRSPLKQRNLHLESTKLQTNSLILLGPAAHKDPTRINFGVLKSTQFFHWVESQPGFTHDESTVKEMSILLAKANHLTRLWSFLKEMSKRNLVTTTSLTCLIKCMAEDGLVNESLRVFYRMRQLRCTPDVYVYNTVILGLCRVGFFKKAKMILHQMELPGFRCPPDTYTYTILISSYCKYAMQTGCSKAVRQRLWEANHLFRLMLFKGFVPDIVTYNCLIDGCCKTNRIERALELFEDMIKRGCAPNRVTYDSFIRYYSVVNEVDKAVEMLRRMEEASHGMATTSSYTPIIHSLCEVSREVEALGFVVELVDRGFVPREYSYKLVVDALRSSGKGAMLDEKLRRKIEDGIVVRYRERMKAKPFMNRKNYALVIEDHHC